MFPRQEMAEDQLTVLPAGRQRCPDVNERGGGFRRLDQHQDPLPRGGPERGTVSLRDVGHDEPIRVDEMQQRPGHHRRHDRHHDHQRIQRLVQDAQLQAHRKDHDPGEPAGVHQRGENPGAPSTDPRETGADEGTAELADDSDQQDEAEFREPGQTNR